MWAAALEKQSKYTQATNVFKTALRMIPNPRVVKKFYEQFQIRQAERAMKVELRVFSSFPFFLLHVDVPSCHSLGLGRDERAR